MPTVQEKISQAKAAGYTDEQIAGHLAAMPEYGDKIKTATAAGYKASDIVGHLSDAAPVAAAGQASEKPGMLPTFGLALGTGVGRTALGAQNLIGQGLSKLGEMTGDAPTISGLVTGKKPASMLGRAGQWLQDDAAQGKTKLTADLAPGKAANPLTASIGETSGEILATLPVGGVIASGLRAALPVAAAVRAAPVLNAIQSAGMRTGVAKSALATAESKAANLGARMAGGAVVGGASSALVSQDHTATGAEIGALLPVAISSLGAGGKVVGAAVRAMTEAGDIAGARSLVKALDAATPEAQREIIAKLRAAPTLVDGASPTVAQALQTPQAGIVNRVVYDSPGGAPLRDKIASQGAARLNALESVAATNANGFASARADMGNAITRAVIPQEAAASKAVSAKYGAVDPTGSEVIPLPIKQMQAAVDKYMGRGTFGSSNSATTALSTAKGLVPPAAKAADAPASWSVMGNPLRDAVEPPAAGWDEIGNLRSSINKAIREAQLTGDKQGLAALNAQKAAVDKAIDGGLTGPAKAAWVDANSSHAAKMAQFHTGPQKAIFRTGQDGLPLVEGGEVAAKFWGQGAGAAENVASFRRLIGDNPELLGQFKSMLTTQGAATTDAAGNLTTKFSKWVDQSLPGLRGAFTPAEVTKLQNIAADLDRNAASIKAGTSLGGSNTYQNASNALDLGLLDSKALEKAATMMPGVKYVAGPVLAGVKGHFRNAKAAQLAEILADSGNAGNAIKRLVKVGATQQQANQILQYLGKGAYRSVPVSVAGSR